MANSVPVATVFVDFESAFDQLWFEGCFGKLGRLGIPKAYINWIRAWLEGRRAVIEIQGMSFDEKRLENRIFDRLRHDEKRPFTIGLVSPGLQCIPPLPSSYYHSTTEYYQ